MFIWIKDTFVPSRLHFKNNVMKRYCQTLDLKVNPAKRNVMVVKNEMRLLKQKRNVFQI